MTTIAETIGTPFFQLSTVGVGALAVGIADIRQRIYNVLNTVPGSDPFRPIFGSLVYLYTDKPITVAIPNIKKEIFDSLSLWMPEIQVNRITHKFTGESQLEFAVTYTLVDDDLIDTINYSAGDITGVTDSNNIIISAFVPAKVTNGIYRVDFDVNGEQVTPTIPSAGFLTATDMLSWISNNWSNYGRWYLTADTLILYLNNGIAKTASLSVTEAAELTIKKLFPLLVAGHYFNLTFDVDGVDAEPEFPTNTFTTIESVLFWVKENWGQYGNWSVEVEVSNGLGDFSIEDFNGDFENGEGIVANYYLIYQTDKYLTAHINFI
jgi:phage baseplate assembly protein W